MDKRFQNIKVLIWDFDGTLYRPNKELFKVIRGAEYKTIAHHTGWSLEKIDKEFHALYKKTIQSAIAVTAHYSGITIPDAMREMETYFDRRTYLKRDEKLIRLFEKLKGYRHIIFGNGVVARQKETISLLGIPLDTFELYVTPELVGITKPDTAGFQYILDYTKLPASKHCIIGDREKVDLVPAKELGMKTCLVWSDTQSAIADVTLRAVYDIERILV